MEPRPLPPDGDPFEPCGWTSDLPTFEGTASRVITDRLALFVRDAGDEQRVAWAKSVPWLQREAGAVLRADTRAAEYAAILEYELPRDSRRPDVIVLQNGVVVVLELKGYPFATQAGLDQVLAYARDLRNFHRACDQRRVIPVLVPSGGGEQSALSQGVHVVGPAGVHRLLLRLAAECRDSKLTVGEFLDPDAYAPLPSIVQAARDLYHGRELPFIKRARAKTEPALRVISEIARNAARTKSRHLVLLSGVPGAGKTLVGLQLVHARWLDELAVPREGRRAQAPAVYLSGNQPLVEVLQHALKGESGGERVFVQHMKNYVAQYSRRRASTPPEHVIVFDEAQRAFDAERVAHVQRSALGRSEPEHLLEFASRIPEWCVIVALIGDGQAIHVGEEGGIGLWRAAIEGSSTSTAWRVHASVDYSEQFRGSGAPVEWRPELNLDTSIRFHLTPRVHQFVRQLLEGTDPAEAGRIGEELYSAGHRFLLTRNLEHGKSYLRERYQEARSFRFGMLASAKDKWLPRFGVDNSFQTTKRLRVGPWYNAEPSDAQSCCQLDAVATEFSSQGLELDATLLAWGSDLLRSDGAWSIENSRGTRGRVHDPEALRRNVYRVLLTRGRDGTVVFAPPSPELDETADYLLGAGFRSID